MSKKEWNIIIKSFPYTFKTIKRDFDSLLVVLNFCMPLNFHKNEINVNIYLNFNNTLQYRRLDSVLNTPMVEIQNKYHPCQGEDPISYKRRHRKENIKEAINCIKNI